jgi:hypothetical protein
VAQLRQPSQRGTGEAAASMDERRRLETLEKWDVRNPPQMPIQAPFSPRKMLHLVHSKHQQQLVLLVRPTD